MKTTMLGRLLTLTVLPALSLAGEALFPLEARAPAPSPAPDAEFIRRNILQQRSITADGTSTCYFKSSDPSMEDLPGI